LLLKGVFIGEYGCFFQSLGVKQIKCLESLIRLLSFLYGVASSSDHNAFRFLGIEPAFFIVIVKGCPLLLFLLKVKSACQRSKE
jgi:hypothetical protein